MQIFYETMSGNTRKLACAMADELGVRAVDVKDAVIGPDADLLFLGSGCYGGVPGKNMIRFIEANDFRGRRIALFGTSGGGEGREVKAMAEAVKRKGGDVIGSYHCKGKVLPALYLINRRHPDAAEVDAARKFAREMAALV
ncbi:MAG: flavodoxin [Methanocella sp. PtaU1.Bin125]|nr:MAG: flavodoxin [Methanocella sp. PtaU1.Bin125]